MRAPKVRAILEGRKAQDRQIVKPGKNQDWLSPDVLYGSPSAHTCIIRDEQWAQFRHPLAGKFDMGVQIAEDSPLACIKCPYGVPGDRLWVKEAWAPLDFSYEDVRPSDLPRSARIVYLADQKQKLSGDRYRPSIHMPRWASRITLDITAVRIERLQDISEADAKAEGAPLAVHHGIDIASSHKQGFIELWKSINGEDSWKSNPWVWVVSFSPTKETPTKETPTKETPKP